MGLPVTIELHGGTYTLTAVIPPRRNGEPNDGAMARASSLLATVQPAAFDPTPVAPKPAVIPHGLAEAMQRDIPPDDDEGEAIPGYRCATGVCDGE